MVSGMSDEATPLNIPLIISKTRGVKREIETHILEFLASYSFPNFPKEKETAMLALNAATTKRKETSSDSEISVPFKKTILPNDECYLVSIKLDVIVKLTDDGIFSAGNEVRQWKRC